MSDPPNSCFVTSSPSLSCSTFSLSVCTTLIERCTFAAADEAVEVDAAFDEHATAQNHLELEPFYVAEVGYEAADEEQHQCGQDVCDLDCPEQLPAYALALLLLIDSALHFESLDLVLVLVEPPAQSHEQPPTDVLGEPEVKHDQANYQLAQEDLAQ